MNWFAARHDDYVPPLVRGMGRYNPKQHARARKLSDDEIRALWKVAEANGMFGALVRLLLLTAQRLEKVVTMRWEDVSDNGVRTIPTEAREKGNAGELVLPKLALQIIRPSRNSATTPSYSRAGVSPPNCRCRNGGYTTCDGQRVLS